MHRSYNSYNPVASKILQKRWDEKHFDDHRKHVSVQCSLIFIVWKRSFIFFFYYAKVHKAKPEIDSAPPVTFMHLHLKLKKLQVSFFEIILLSQSNDDKFKINTVDISISLRELSHTINK
jgi:hypothetical protein